MSGSWAISLINPIVRIIAEMCNIDTEEVNSRHKSINSGTRRPVPAAIQYVQLHPLCSPITSFVVCLPLNVPVISTGWTT